MSTLKLRIKGVFFLLGRKPFSLEGNSHHLGKTSLKRHLFHLANSKMPVHQKGYNEQEVHINSKSAPLYFSLSILLIYSHLRGCISLT